MILDNCKNLFKLGSQQEIASLSVIFFLILINSDSIYLNDKFHCLYLYKTYNQNTKISIQSWKKLLSKLQQKKKKKAQTFTTFIHVTVMMPTRPYCMNYQKDYG